MVSIILKAGTICLNGKNPITIPKHEPIKKVYVEMVRQVVEEEAGNEND